MQGKYTDPKTVQQIRDGLKNGTKVEVQILNYRRDGTPFLNGFVMLPLHEKGKIDGRVEYFLAVQKNVTVIVNPWRSPLEKWSVPEVCMWLDRPDVQGQAYIKPFLQHDVSGVKLDRVTMEKLQDFGVVLQSERERLYKLITQEKASRLAADNLPRLRPSVTEESDASIRSEEDLDNTSRDGSPPLTRRELQSLPSSRDEIVAYRRPSGGSSILASSAGSSPTDGASYRRTSGGSNILMPSTSSGSSSRKGLITAEFVGNIRPKLSILASTNADRSELRRVLRKKMGRKYEVEQMDAPDGRVSSLRVVLRPTHEGIESHFFSVLEGVQSPILVTDGAALVLYANDKAWEALSIEDDPVDRFILDLVHLDIGKLEFVSDLRHTTFKAQKGMFVVSVSPVQILKAKLHVWTFERTTAGTIEI